MINADTLNSQKQIFGHPAGLYVLFFTEMWERFSYYGMRAILVLYLVAESTPDTINPGLNWETGAALSLYGTYTMLVYVASIPGGWIADNILGQKKSVLYGGILLVLGHSILAVEEMWAFYTGLGLIIAGVGMLKPNISNIYASEKTDRLFMGWLVPASWFQSLNAMFIICLGTGVAGYWAKRKLKNQLSSSLFKMIIGLIIMGTGFFFMSAASTQYETQGSSAMYWLVLAYLFHTIGELCISPVALSFITKLAPLKYASLTMGVYFAMTGFGNKLAGILGEASQSMGEFTIFTGIAIFCVVFGCLVLLFRTKLEKLTHGAEDDN